MQICKYLRLKTTSQKCKKWENNHYFWLLFCKTNQLIICFTMVLIQPREAELLKMQATMNDKVKLF